MRSVRGIATQSVRSWELCLVFMMCRVRAAPPQAGRDHQFRMFTLRAITSASSTKPEIACTIMNSFARTLRGITSVGLNAIALDAEK